MDDKATKRGGGAVVAMALVAVLVLLPIGCVADSLANDRVAAEKRELVVTVVGENIFLDQITPTEAAQKRQELSVAEFQEWLLDYRMNLLLNRVIGQVLEEYALREKLSPSDEELDAIFRDVSHRYLANRKLDEGAKTQFSNRMFWLKAASRDWRTAKALHQKYGGRIAVSAFGGCTSVEGRNAVLRDFATAGDTKFHHQALEQAFWKRVSDERVLDVTMPIDQTKDFLAAAPWERAFKTLADEASPSPR